MKILFMEIEIKKYDNSNHTMNYQPTLQESQQNNVFAHITDPNQTTFYTSACDPHDIHMHCNSIHDKRSVDHETVLIRGTQSHAIVQPSPTLELLENQPSQTRQEFNPLYSDLRMSKSCQSISSITDMRNFDKSIYPSEKTQLHLTTPIHDKLSTFGVDSRQQMKYQN